MAMTVKKDNNEVRIQWRVADIKIPTSEITNISQDQNIDTKDHEYIIYTQNDQKIYNEITK
jgi:hypothetical protein